MIKVYANGIEFYEDNKDFLLTNPYTEVFYRLDSPLLTEVNKEEYAIKVFQDHKTLLVLKKEPFNILYFGDKELTSELLDYLISNEYRLTDYLAPMELGDELLKELVERGYPYKLSIGMDFMECKERHAPSSDIVENATKDDIDELYECEIAFFKDCGLKDEANREHIEKRIDFYRVIRVDGVIASLARYYYTTATGMGISMVYTRDEYRGRGYAKIICNNILNEIMDKGKIATLNVDQKNPISYHIYSSIGFKKIFSQGIYVKE